MTLAASSHASNGLEALSTCTKFLHFRAALALINLIHEVNYIIPLKHVLVRLPYPNKLARSKHAEGADAEIGQSTKNIAQFEIMLLCKALYGKRFLVKYLLLTA